MRMSRRNFCALGAAGAVFGTATNGAGRHVLLTVSGNVDGGSVTFDREALRALDWREVSTFTSFTEGSQTFAGPTLASVLAAVAAKGGQIHATAINDYTVTFPLSDAEEFDILLAMDHNGRAMRVRDKGPIWIVYPMSEDQSEDRVHDAEMIWQLDRLIVE